MPILLYCPVLLASVVFTCAYEVGSPTGVVFAWVCSSNCCRWWLCLWDLLLLLESAAHGEAALFPVGAGGDCTSRSLQWWRWCLCL